MPQQEIRKIRIQILREHLQGANGTNQILISIRLARRIGGIALRIVIIPEITEIILISVPDRAAMTRQVASGYDKSVRSHETGEIIIPVDKFLHAVYDLQDSHRRDSFVRNPSQSPDLCLTVP